MQLVGWLTKRYDPPFKRMQMNFIAPFLDVTDQQENQRPDCPCANFRGWADQGEAEALISSPLHWPAVSQYNKRLFFVIVNSEQRIQGQLPIRIDAMCQPRVLELL